MREKAVELLKANLILNAFFMNVDFRPQHFPDLIQVTDVELCFPSVLKCSHDV